MQAFLFMLALISILIAFGVCLSLYLYKGGAVGKRRRVRAQSFQTATADDYGEDEFYEGLAPTVSTTTSLARSSLVVFLAGFAIIAMLLTSYVSTVLH